MRADTIEHVERPSGPHEPSRVSAFKIAAAQVASIRGDIDANIAAHAAAIEAAAEHEVSVLVFPELSPDHMARWTLPQVPSEEAAPFWLKRKIVMHHTHR